MKKITLVLTFAFLSSVVFQSCDKKNGLTPPQTTPTSSISVEQKNMGLILNSQEQIVIIAEIGVGLCLKI
jgi:hypothetical protein